MFYEGRQIGNYTLLRKLGKGGFGEVWLAEKRSQFVAKKVAVKLPLDEQVNFDAIRQEAELWEQASGHSNVLPIIDADVVDGQVIIVSEYADGGSLADLLKRDGKLPLQKAVEMTIGILSGLGFLHNRKIIHRDIKPQNILLQGDTPRLADFGISRAMNTTAVSSAIIGTDAYMSPESFDGKRTIQTDIWSVGVVLYALLADRLPFSQEHPSERMFAILTKEFAPLPAEVPQNLQRIVYRALAKQPENRYQTTGEMRDELQKALIGIAHPTLAPTEVFHIPNENLPTIPTHENKDEAAEAENETVINPKNIKAFPAIGEQSKVTAFREKPPTDESAVLPTQKANKPPAASARTDSEPQKWDNAQRAFFAPTVGEKSRVKSEKKIDIKSQEFKFFIALFGGLLFVLLISFIFSKKGAVTPSVSTNSAKSLSSPSVTASNTPSNIVSKPASNTTSTTKMNIEMESTKENAAIYYRLDGKSSAAYIDAGEVKEFNPEQELELTYHKDDANSFIMRINGKKISIPTVPNPGNPNVGNSIQFKIKKENIDRILQTGVIPDSEGK